MTVILAALLALVLAACAASPVAVDPVAAPRPLLDGVDGNPTPAVRAGRRQVKPLPPPRIGCDGIYDELVRQGASDSVARRFAYFIAPRESGCRAVYVDDHDDWSYSRFGLNGRTATLRAYWRYHCGADVRADTVNLAIDVKCALAAYRDRGWQPWAYA